MNDINLPFATLVTLGGILVSAGASWAVTKRMAEASEKRAEAAEDKADAVARELAEFKLDASRRFVTDEMLAKVEERIVGAIDRLADRLDRVIEGRAK